jgi:hypothetical protein
LTVEAKTGFFGRESQLISDREEDTFLSIRIVVPSQPWESTSGIYWQIPAIIVASKYGKMPKEKSTFTRQRKMLGGPGRLPNIKTKKIIIWISHLSIKVSQLTFITIRLFFKKKKKGHPFSQDKHAIFLMISKTTKILR